MEDIHEHLIDSEAPLSINFITQQDKDQIPIVASSIEDENYLSSSDTQIIDDTNPQVNYTNNKFNRPFKRNFRQQNRTPDPNLDKACIACGKTNRENPFTSQGNA